MQVNLAREAKDRSVLFYRCERDDKGYTYPKTLFFVDGGAPQSLTDDAHLTPGSRIGVRIGSTVGMVAMGDATFVTIADEYAALARAFDGGPRVIEVFGAGSAVIDDVALGTPSDEIAKLPGVPVSDAFGEEGRLPRWEVAEVDRYLLARGFLGGTGSTALFNAAVDAPAEVWIRTAEVPTSGAVDLVLRRADGGETRAIFALGSPATVTVNQAVLTLPRAIRAGDRLLLRETGAVGISGERALAFVPLTNGPASVRMGVAVRGGAGVAEIGGGTVSPR